MVTPERIWTPWRMRYLSGGAREAGCVFCNRASGDNDVESLILHRGDHNFVIMNLFPYGTGHIMIVPYEHVSRPGDLSVETRHEMVDLLPMLTDVQSSVFSCEGFNVGMNLGTAAGAGIAEHLHQHLVPRWSGDANFMPIIAATKAIPETLPAQYAKLRAEIERGEEDWRLVLLSRDLRSVATAGSSLPIFQTVEDSAVWKSALECAAELADEIEIVGWAGAPRAGDPGAKALIAVGNLAPQTTSKPTDNADLGNLDAAILRRALDQLAPLV